MSRGEEGGGRREEGGAVACAHSHSAVILGQTRIHGREILMAIAFSG